MHATRELERAQKSSFRHYNYIISCVSECALILSLLPGLTLVQRQLMRPPPPSVPHLQETKIPYPCPFSLKIVNPHSV